MLWNEAKYARDPRLLEGTGTHGQSSCDEVVIATLQLRPSTWFLRLLSLQQSDQRLAKFLTVLQQFQVTRFLSCLEVKGRQNPRHVNTNSTGLSILADQSHSVKSVKNNTMNNEHISIKSTSSMTASQYLFQTSQNTKSVSFFSGAMEILYKVSTVSLIRH